MIAYLLLEIRIEGAHSLKDKRQVVRSVKDGLRNRFNVAVAEVEASEAWQRATLGVVSISDSRDYLEIGSSGSIKPTTRRNWKRFAAASNEAAP